MKLIQTYLRHHGALLAIIGTGLLIRGALLLAYLSAHEWKAETWEAEEVAVNLLEGRGFTFYNYGPHVYRSLLAPVFPSVLYLTHFFGGRGLWLYYAVQLAIAAGIIWLTFAIADRWFGRRTAMIAAAFVALEPGLVVYQSYKVDDIALGTLLLLLGVQTFALMSLTYDRRLAGFTGLIMSAAMLTRSDLIGMFGLLPVWACRERKRLRLILKPTLLLILAAVLLWAPWAIRNYVVQDQFVFLTTFSGEAFWLGNQPNSFGSTVTLDGQPLFEAADPEFKRQIEASNELQKDALFKREVRRFVAGDPMGFVARSLTKVYYFWWFIPTYAKDKDYYAWIPSLLLDTYKLAYAITLGLAVLGVWMVCKDGDAGGYWLAVVLVTIMASITIIHAITLVNGRHRVLVMPLLLILTAHGLGSVQRLTTWGKNVSAMPLQSSGDKSVREI